MGSRSRGGGRSALSLAACAGHVACVRVLLEHGDEGVLSLDHLEDVGNVLVVRGLQHPQRLCAAVGATEGAPLQTLCINTLSFANRALRRAAAAEGHEEQ